MNARGAGSPQRRLLWASGAHRPVAPLPGGPPGAVRELLAVPPPSCGRPGSRFSQQGEESPRPGGQDAGPHPCPALPGHVAPQARAVPAPTAF